MLHTIEVRTHGRYLVDVPPGPGPWPVIVGFHGYGENAAIHLDVLRKTVGGRPWLIASVQGLNRFYTRQDDVVAGWMTREDRELAIADNEAYVAAVIEAVASHYATRAPLVFAGFSQGVAMAYRAAARHSGRCHGLLLLAGDVPPDVVPRAAGLPPVLLGRGTRETWYTPGKAAADVAVLRSAGVMVEEFVFDGGHEWAGPFAQRAGEWLDERLR